MSPALSCSSSYWLSVSSSLSVIRYAFALSSFSASSIKLISWSHFHLSGSFSNFFLLNKCVNSWMYFERSLGFVGSGSLSPPFDSSSSFGSSLFDHRVNHIDLCSVLQCPRHLVNHMTLFFQSTSRLCSTSQLCPRNRSVSLISDTTASICSMCPFKLISKGTNSLIVFSPFLDLSKLYTLNGLGSDLVNIPFSSTVFLVMVVFVYPESINALTLSFLPFLVLIIRCTISSLDCSLRCGITYQFLVKLFTVVHHIMPIPNLRQNPSVLHYLSLHLLRCSVPYSDMSFFATLETSLWFLLFLWLSTILCYVSKFVTVVTLGFAFLSVILLSSYFHWFAHFSIGYSWTCPVVIVNIGPLISLSYCCDCHLLLF